MSDYADRLGEAMQLERVDVTTLAKGLRVSYQAVKKVIDGRTHAFTADNNVRAARLLKVDSEWLSPHSTSTRLASRPLTSASRPVQRSPDASPAGIRLKPAACGLFHAVS